MVAVIGDVVEPIELVLPKKTGVVTGKLGNIFISGAKLWFNPSAGNTPELVTSA